MGNLVWFPVVLSIERYLTDGREGDVMTQLREKLQYYCDINLRQIIISGAPAELAGH